MVLKEQAKEGQLRTTAPAGAPVISVEEFLPQPEEPDPTAGRRVAVMPVAEAEAKAAAGEIPTRPA